MLFGGFEPPEDTREVLCSCDVCGDRIRSGDIYYNLDGSRIHKDCLDEMSRKDILALLGIKEETA